MRALVVAVVLSMLACGRVIGAGAESTSSSGSTSGESTTSTTTGESSTTLPETTTSDTAGAPIDCTDRNPNFECAPMDCEHPIYQFECGSITVDDDGCFRPWCHAQADCPMGLVCYKDAECDPEAAGCGGLGGCGMLGDECTCTAVGGCQDAPPPIEQQRGYCIPSELRPC
jgi:hypothetical protein